MNILILGNGQLGQMLGKAVIQHGHQCLLYSDREHKVKALGSQQALAMSLAEATAWADVATWEHEHLAEEIITTSADKILLKPEQFARITDRRSQKQLCDDLGIPTSPWRAYENAEQLAEILQHCDRAVVIKSAKGGYDGKGQWRWKPGQEIDTVAAEAGVRPGIVEDMIAFTDEVSVVAARSHDNQQCAYPLTLNVHQNGILSYSLAGTTSWSNKLEQLAQQHHAKLCEALDYVGVLAIEFFVVGEGEQQQLLVNEVAPRVHNSGHWTMSGANYDQFALHIRAITGMPLPELLCAPTLMLNAIGVAGYPELLWKAAAADCHWYGKDPRPGRKVGHINMIIDNAERGVQLAQEWAPQLQQLAE
ncbi:phosphoribosylaminoimidazole carboxylase [Idiomarina tyrosinivorans]|uniref:N5-carboxyaminoimidazole ribonucleotide synthase n=1 Tax=Idiomarina tyrosinivorans TaxID=1445662 RepID=A0A432ZTF0_9GAMM|nr:ATP-grasp domain-containing protein [Idiomarina tyrosinivorans]RUO81066.1 phosphoribosylaminoimidazole carboxylase [Idiomarina tyrosinivorans]